MQQDKYCIYVVAPPTYLHSRAFDELTLGLQEGFAKLGYDAPIVNDVNLVTGQAVVFGAHLMATTLPEDAVIFNTEQLRSGWMNEDYLQTLRQHVVWDYSPNNAARLTERGVRHVRICKIGYAACLHRIVSRPETLDVLFYGSIFGRRESLLGRIKPLHTVFGTYGLGRDALIARSKIIVNIHAYDEATLEWPRIAYLLNNGKFVVSEHSDEEPPGVAFGTAEELSNLCRYYLHHDDERRALAAKGLAEFRKTTQAQYLREALTPRPSGPSGQ